ncbi:MAG: 4-(cytidine 5'-diphospho)-2-C-methyl-D-erythritol kinase [Betaproteobacteria bacterium]|nr:4-(cytidine 5'-diphospho)-2-C-methyl-D-erythritol kinase [Betaproteobacteria bacterium]
MKNPWQFEWPAPAKLNLFLHVVGRRADGYHLLQTVFRFLDFGDSLSFVPRDDDRILLTTPLPGVPPEQNLTVRAAQNLKQATGVRQGVEIRLVKQLPLGGGLGGGSSDAATVLLALNRLWETNLSSAELQQIGIQLGADVPIFIHGHAAFAEGIGERFVDVVLPPAWYLVLVPPVTVPTAEIFQSPDLRRDTPAINAADWRPGMGGNDLEPVACRLYPEVAEHLAWLRRFGPARMSGSGACVFAEFATLEAANAAHAANAAFAPGMQGFVARGLDRSPVAALL